MSKKNLARAAKRKSRDEARDEARDFRLKRAERSAAEDEAAQAAREGSASVDAARERTQAARLAKIEAIAEDRARQRANEYISHEEFRNLTKNERERLRLIGGRGRAPGIKKQDAEIKKRKIRAAINQYLRDHPFKKYSAQFITDRLWRSPNTYFPDGIPYAYTKFRKEVGLMLAKIRPRAR